MLGYFFQHARSERMHVVVFPVMFVHGPCQLARKAWSKNLAPVFVDSSLACYASVKYFSLVWSKMSSLVARHLHEGMCDSS